MSERPARDTDALEKRVHALEEFCRRLQDRLLDRLGFDLSDEPRTRDEHAPAEFGEAALS